MGDTHGVHVGIVANLDICGGAARTCMSKGVDLGPVGGGVPGEEEGDIREPKVISTMEEDLGAHIIHVNGHSGPQELIIRGKDKISIIHARSHRGMQGRIISGEDKISILRTREGQEVEGEEMGRTEGMRRDTLGLT